MKRTNVIRALTLLLCLTALLSLSALPAVAAEDGSASASEEHYVNWSYDERTGELTAYFPDTDTTQVYTEATLPSRVLYFPIRLYEYANTVDVGDQTYYLTALDRGEQAVCLENEDNARDTRLFLTQAGRQAVADCLQDPDYTSVPLIYRTSKADYYSSMAADLPDDLAALPAEGQISCSLFDLRNEQKYELVGLASPFAVTVGYLFEIEETLYYLDATALSDACFDGKGGLNPMPTVTVTLTPLTSELSQRIYDKLSDASAYDPTVVYEAEEEPYDPTVERITGPAPYPSLRGGSDPPPHPRLWQEEAVVSPHRHRRRVDDSVGDPARRGHHRRHPGLIL